MKELLCAADLAQALERLAQSLMQAHPASQDPLHLIGIRSRGDEVAERLAQRLQQDGRTTRIGVLDISLYRDDLAHLHQNPQLQGSDIPFPIDGAHLILVDDVLFTGRTIRAALDALTDYGRPSRIELATLIDRGHRELPIEPQFVGTRLETQRLDHVHVLLQGTDGRDGVEIENAPAS